VEECRPNGITAGLSWPALWAFHCSNGGPSQGPSLVGGFCSLLGLMLAAGAYARCVVLHKVLYKLLYKVLYKVLCKGKSGRSDR